MGVSPVPMLASVLRTKYGLLLKLLAGTRNSTPPTVPVSCTCHKRAVVRLMGEGPAVVCVKPVLRPLSPIASKFLSAPNVAALLALSAAMLAKPMLMGNVDETTLTDCFWFSVEVSSRPITVTRFW